MAKQPLKKGTPAGKPVAQKAPAPKKEAAPAEAETKAPAAEVTPIPKKAKGFEVGQEAQFVGYLDEPNEDEVFFEPGDVVRVVRVDDVPVLAKDEAGNEVETGKTETVYVCIKADETEAYEADPDSVEAQQLQPKELRRLKQSAAAKEEEPVEVKRIGELTVYLGADKDPVEVAKELFNQAEKTKFYLGGVLSIIFHEKLYVTKYGYTKEREKEGDGYGTHPETGKPLSAWQAFCFEKLGYSERSARVFMSIYDAFSRLEGFDPARLNTIGWSKAMLLAPVVEEKNAAELLDKAENSTFKGLQEEIRTNYSTKGSVGGGGEGAGGGTRQGGTPVRKTTFTFQLAAEAAENATTILEGARKQLNLPDNAAAFEHILSEWAVDHLQDPNAVGAAEETEATRAAQQAAE